MLRRSGGAAAFGMIDRHRFTLAHPRRTLVPLAIAQIASIGTVALGAATPARADDVVAAPQSSSSSMPVIKPITDGTTACTQDIEGSRSGHLPGQCAFDNAVFGTRMDSRIDTDALSLQTYVVAAGTIGGLLTADQLLTPSKQRFGDRGSLVVFGTKGSFFDGRLSIAAETDWSQNRYFALERSAAPQLPDGRGHSNSLKIDFKLLDSPSFNWSVSGNYNEVSSGYSTGRSFSLMRYFALPGTRLDAGTNATIGNVAVGASLDNYDSILGNSRSERANATADGVSLTVMNRNSTTRANSQILLLQSDMHMMGVYADLDLSSMTTALFSNATKLPWIVPVSISTNMQSGTYLVDAASEMQLSRRSSFEISASWNTPAGDTDVDYLAQHRTGLVNIASGYDGYLELSHSIFVHHWRFGVDALVSTDSTTGTAGSRDSGVSLGASVSYFVPDGPEFRFQVGSDLTSWRMSDDSYATMERYSSIVGSLDLSRYLQHRFNRNDLHFSLDFRRALSVDKSSLFDSPIQDLTDAYDRSGILATFSMKL